MNLQVYKVLRIRVLEKEEMIQYGSVRGFGFGFGVRVGLGGYGNESLYVILGPRNTGDKNCVSFKTEEQKEAR